MGRKRKTSSIIEPSLFGPDTEGKELVPPPQFLKWIGNKQRFAPKIAAYVPADYRRYFEPFVGSGAVLGAMGPAVGIAGDTHRPLVELWQLLQTDSDSLLSHYSRLWHDFQHDRNDTYQRAKASYNASPNPRDLLFLCRSCYGGVVRFRMRDGFMSTPIGPHNPVPPASLKKRMDAWRQRIKGTTFRLADYSETMAEAGEGDVIYCDPPYKYSQTILYGAQTFRVADLWKAIERCVSRGAKVLVSLDGNKKSGSVTTEFEIPAGLFKREEMIDCGRSMLRRFQMAGETLEAEVVQDRLLLTW